VLGADQHRIHAHGAAIAIFHRHLALAIGAQPGQLAALAHGGQFARQVVGQVDRHGHQGGGFVAGKAEHHSLVAGANGFNFGLAYLTGLGFHTLVHAHGNIARLGADGRLHRAGVTIKTFFAAVITDFSDHAAHQFVKVDEGAGGDLAQHHHKAGFGGGFTGHARGGVLLQAGVQHGIAHLVAELVGVAFGYRFGSEQVMGRVHKSCVHHLSYR